MSQVNYAKHEVLENKGAIIHPDDGETLMLGGGSCNFKITSEISNNQLGVYEIILPPKTVGAKLHYHEHLDETFIVNKGVLTVQLGDAISEIGAGVVMYAPRLTPHSFANESDEEVKILLVFNPSNGREGFFRGLFELLAEKEFDVTKFMKLNHEFDTYPM